MKVYLAGPMRGCPLFNFPAFDYAAKKLRDAGHEVFSPAERDREVYGHKLEETQTGDEKEATAAVGFSLRAALETDTQWICRHANAIALLPGWEKSSGATAENALAVALGLTRIILGTEYAT